MNLFVWNTTIIYIQCLFRGVNGQAAVWRVDLANKQEHEHVIKIVMAFKMMTSKKHKVAIMATVQVNIDVWGMLKLGSKNFKTYN